MRKALVSRLCSGDPKQGLISALALERQAHSASRLSPVAAHDPRTGESRAPRNWIDDVSTQATSLGCRQLFCGIPWDVPGIWDQ